MVPISGLDRSSGRILGLLEVFCARGVGAPSYRHVSAQRADFSACNAVRVDLY